MDCCRSRSAGARQGTPSRIFIICSLTRGSEPCAAAASGAGLSACGAAVDEPCGSAGALFEIEMGISRLPWESSCRLGLALEGFPALSSLFTSHFRVRMLHARRPHHPLPARSRFEVSFVVWTLLLALFVRSAALLVSPRAPFFFQPLFRAASAAPHEIGGPRAVRGPAGPAQRRLRQGQPAGRRAEIPAHMRSEDLERFEALRDLRNGASGSDSPRGAELKFPPTLSAGQRAMLHAAAANLGLGHESAGNGNHRRVRVWAKGVDERLTDLERVLAEQERGTVAAEAHAAAVEKLRHELLSRPSGSIARLLSFLLGPHRQASDPNGSRELTLLDSLLGPEQTKAVETCQGSAVVVVIQGLPGTGKSRTLLEVMRQHAKQGKVRPMHGPERTRPHLIGPCSPAFRVNLPWAPPAPPHFPGTRYQKPL